MKDLNYTTEIYTPRWGHTDQYSFTFSDKGIEYHGSTKIAKMSFDDDGELQWTGHGEGTINPLLSIMEDDQIYAPSVVVEALEHAWHQWRDGVASADLKEALDDLFRWIDTIARSRPQAEFWTNYF